MLGHYLLIAIRILMRNRVYAAINIGGLALALAGCVLILGYIRYEQSYDGWLKDSGRLFQVQTTIHPPGQPDVRTQASPFPVGEQLAAGFPQVEAITSLSAGKTVTERDGQPVFIDATTVDGNFFKVFDLPFAYGSAATALPDTNSIVLTEKEAIRQFGTADVLGRRFTLGAGPGKRDYKVSGVLRDLPRNTSLRIGVMYRGDIADIPIERRGWGNFDQLHYVKLRAGADAAMVNAALPGWEKRAVPSGTLDGKQFSMADVFDLRLEPITGVHLGVAQEAALTPAGDPRALVTFAVVALLTLGMAVMNFVNLTTARALQRTREVALRKVLGARRRELIAQFMAENVLIAAVAVLIAMAIAELAMPWVAQAMGADMQLRYLGKDGMLLPVLALFAITGLAGGLYPALYLSRFKPAPVLNGNRGSTETAGSGRLRMALVVVQFAIAIGLVTSTAVIWSQTRFVEQVDPGFRRDGLIQIANAWRYTQGGEYDAARRAMLAIPGVTKTGRTGLGPGDTEQKMVWLARTPGASQYVSLKVYNIDADFLPTMAVKLLAGRMLGDRQAADRIADETPGQLATRGINVVINRGAATKLGYRAPQAAIGQVVDVWFNGAAKVPATIAGVVEDTRFGTARDAVGPIVYVYDPGLTNQVLVRYAAARPGDVMAALAKIWRRFEPEIPFEARFTDDVVRELYAAERARTVLFASFSLLAIVIACLGLYSLAAFATERRTKEIGIRKVLGARSRDIVRLLVTQFSRPVLIANLIAWPAAWWVMRDWLNGFDARIALTPTPFLIAGGLALVIAVVTVAGQAIRVARRNPIHALRYE
jgi:putative ABC transport system permease protein